MRSVRRAIKLQMLGMVGGSEGAPRERVDDGLFGPRSVAWRVHGDVAAMMIGGVGALLLQMLHPAALAGVWDHSDFRRDMGGRLRRTARFISGTTYGSTAEAEALIGRVRAIHARVAGELPDGTPYRADDPDLLTWVHAAEVRSFLKAHLRFRDPLMPDWEQDRYVAEMARIAEKLGAPEPPRSRQELETYLEAMRPRLKADDRTRAAAQALTGEPPPSLAFAPAYRVMMRSGIDLLPDWARRMHGFRAPRLARPAAAVGALGLASVVRWAMSAPQPSG